MLKPELMLINMVGNFNLKNEPSNVKRVRLIKRSIMRIFDEAEPP